MKIEYHPAIEQELRDIASYYNTCLPGLGTEFIDEFEKQINRIAAMPRRWQVIENGIRRSLMRRFPFVIYFRLNTDDLLRILIIKHQRRHPGYGQTRQ